VKGGANGNGHGIEKKILSTLQRARRLAKAMPFSIVQGRGDKKGPETTKALGVSKKE